MVLAFSSVSARATAKVVIDWVKVGDPGNPESPAIKKDETSGYGAVDYDFRIGKYETTNIQYTEFLNSVAASDTNDLYDAAMESSVRGGITRTGISGSYTYTVKANMDNKPVNFVSWFDSARFANWLHNRQPVGTQSALTTEDGAYTFSGPETVSTRNDRARFFLPNEHEWDKAAFYEPGAVTLLGDGWWKFPSHSDVVPMSATTDAFGNVSNPGPNVVVYRRVANWNGSVGGNVATVGSAGNESYYGARDMTGNVFEWVKADPDKPDPLGWGPYTVRGGSFVSAGHVDVFERNLVHHHNHAVVDDTVGFRLASPFFLEGDFNNDFFVNRADLALWESSYTGPLYDLDNDGLVDGSDFLLWQRIYNNVPPEIDMSSANLDQQGLVDFRDILIWEQSYALDGGGDVNGDGVSDGIDFL